MTDALIHSNALSGAADSDLNAGGVACPASQLQTRAVAEAASYQVQSNGQLRITGELSIKTMIALHQALSDHAGRGSDLVLDLSAVHECDTAALQLIYSLRRTAAEGRKCFRIADASPEIEEIAAGLGLRIKELHSDGISPGDPGSGSRGTEGGIQRS